jgi:hypothetical protein
MEAVDGRVQGAGATAAEYPMPSRHNRATSGVCGPPHGEKASARAVSQMRSTRSGGTEAKDSTWRAVRDEPVHRQIEAQQCQ